VKIEAEAALRARTRELARRINLLLDVIVAETGEAYTFNQIAAGLKKDGVNLSSGRWFYMISGEGPLTTDLEMLEALATFFEIDSSYLVDWNSELPQRINAQLELVKAIRAAKLTTLAARMVGPLDTEGVEMITALINSQMKDLDPPLR